jgi:single-strand DNA-binding protein
MNKISGTIVRIFDEETFGNNFTKRLFWLEDDAEKYKNTFQFETWKGDTVMLNDYKVGDFITVYYDVKGQKWEKNGREGVMNTLKAWNIEHDGKYWKEINKTK